MVHYEYSYISFIVYTPDIINDSSNAFICELLTLTLIPNKLSGFVFFRLVSSRVCIHNIIPYKNPVIVYMKYLLCLFIHIYIYNII